MGAKRDGVKLAQRYLKVKEDGVWGPKTQAAYDGALAGDKGVVDQILSSVSMSVDAIRLYQSSGGDQTKQTFRERVVPEVRRLAAAKGLNGDLMVAQMALETGGGGRTPPGSYNWAGIKAVRGLPSVEASTKEAVNGKLVTMKQNFAVFKTPEEFASFYVNRLADSKRFGQAYRIADLKSGAKALQVAGYATDPDYATKVASAASKLA